MAELRKAPWSDWETVRLIGRGSFGTVYEVQRQLVDDDVETAAMKVITIPQNSDDIEEMYSEGYDDESITATFNSRLKSIVAEYSLMRKMDGSANVVNCKDIRYIQHDDGIGWDIYIRMELLTPLMKALPVSAEEDTVIRIGKDICNALVLCKKHEIVHRDIKPQNIFVSSNGDYKLGDFGIAKTVEKTMGGTKIGTYKYMAPEVYNNQPYGSGADIYSLGLVLYWLLNERRMPFVPLPPEKLTAGAEEEARYRRLSGEKLPAPAHGSDELKRIVLKACAYDPKDRYASAAEMLLDLNKLDCGAIVIETTDISNNKVDIYEDEKTTGPVFVVAQKQEESDVTPEEVDATVGPDFLPKPVPFREPEKERKYPSVHQEKRSVVLKYILVATAILLAIILILLLRSCWGGEKPSTDVGQMSQQGWSAWVDKLPENVTAENYEIEEITLYSSRMLEITSSTDKNSVEGWELFDTVEANGQFGPWSGWSEAKVEASSGREVETQVRYRYKEKETTTSSSPSKEGWIHYDTRYSWGNYGPWSSWSTAAVTNSDSRKVETKTQYRYRPITYSTEYTAWGSWSSWQDNAISETDLRDVETREVYPYYYYYCKRCGEGTRWYSYGGGCGACGTVLEASSETIVWFTTPWSEAGPYRPYGSDTGKYAINVNGLTYWAWTNGSPKMQYQYRTRSTQQVTNYGSWSNWGDTSYSSSSSRDVQTRTVYRYCDRPKDTIYCFYRWSDWSNWYLDEITETSDRQVESTAYYRYREQAQVTTYYFKRWTEWSVYSETAVSPSETVEVQTKTQYRYKLKEN